MDRPGIELRVITRENIRAVLMLKVKPEQECFVASNAVSLAQAYVYQGRAWPRAVYADGELVGFVMLDLIGTDHAEYEGGTPYYYIWRLMIDARHQGKGYGRAALLAVIEYIRSLPGAQEVKLSYVPKPGNPEPFYRSLGFEPNGVIDEDGEPEMILKL